MVVVMVMLLVLMASGQRRRGQLGLFLERAGTKRARVASDFSRALAWLRIPHWGPLGFLLHSLPLWTRNTRKCTRVHSRKPFFGRKNTTATSGKRYGLVKPAGSGHCWSGLFLEHGMV